MSSMDFCVCDLSSVQNRCTLSEMLGYFALFSLHCGLCIFSFNVWDNPVANNIRRSGLFLNFNFLADHSRTNRNAFSSCEKSAPSACDFRGPIHS